MAKYVRKAPRRSVKKSAVGPNPNRRRPSGGVTGSNYSYSYYPGQSNNRDRPIQVFENRHNRKPNVRTYNTPREPWRHERIGRPTPSSYYRDGGTPPRPPGSPTGTPDIAPPATPIPTPPKTTG